jgi:hypothetical protein
MKGFQARHIVRSREANLDGEGEPTTCAIKVEVLCRS